MEVKGKIKSITTSAVITRADGTVEDLGVIGFTHMNPLLTWAWRIKNFIKKLLKIQ